MAEIIPLFPLRSVLFPAGKLQLQIFEQRYLDMIRNTLREGSGFGICLIREGDEVVRAGSKQTIHRIGTYAHIVDWDSLPNGMLGITAEGQRKFLVLDCWTQDDQLLLGKVEFSDKDNKDAHAVPLDEDNDTLAPLLRQLMNHPMIEQLQMTVDFSNLREVGWRLSELLPVPPAIKQSLLEMDDPHERARELEGLITNMVNQS